MAVDTLYAVSWSSSNGVPWSTDSICPCISSASEPHFFMYFLMILRTASRLTSENSRTSSSSLRAAMRPSRIVVHSTLSSSSVPGLAILKLPTPSPSSPAPLPPAEAAETPVPREWAALSLPPLAQPG